MDDAGLGGPVAVEFDRVEADHEHEVAGVDVVVEIRGSEALDRADEERMVLAEDALRLRAHHHRYLPGLSETPERLGDGILVGVHPDEQERPLAAAQLSRRGTHRIVVNRRDRLGRKTRERHVDGLLPGDVARHLEIDRTAAHAPGHPKRSLDHRGGVRRADRGLPLRDRREELFQIQTLVRRDLIPLGRQLPAQGDDRSAVEIRMCDPGHEVGRAWPEGGEADAGHAGDGRRGLGHERGGRLVLGQDELKSSLAKSLDEVDHLSARMPEHMSHARRAQTVADRARDGQSHAHRMPPQRSPCWRSSRGALGVARRSQRGSRRRAHSSSER